MSKVRFRNWFAYQIVSKHGPWATVTVHILRQSTSLTMIRYSTSFISTDQPRSMQTTTQISASTEGRNGCVNDGGTNSYTFANYGGTSYLGRRPIWVFVSSVHLARPLHICWHIHLPFPLIATLPPSISLCLSE